MARIENSRKMTCRAGDLTVAVLKEFLEGLKEDAIIHVKSQVGLPGEYSTVTFASELNMNVGRVN